MNYYAVKKGRKTGIYATWDETLKQVSGFSGAVYKKFKNKNEAINFLNDNENENLKNEEIDISNIKSDEIICYVDGSYNVFTEEYGYGVVYFSNKEKVEIFGKGLKKEYSVYRNVAGEVFGSVKAIKRAISERKNKIYIHYDYEGIEKWATGGWKTNNELTKNYKSFIDGVKNNIDIVFVKVIAHTGDKYNERADELAKKGAGVER